ncbi:class I SAM-dependent methyltransferase [Snuella lapsa]|uniref:Methyltransferase type 11 domain-containing protein n=1 Tax=Snuella lapsa TaxID=870481 RepID=A0ABP6XS98_9FLAO
MSKKSSREQIAYYDALWSKRLRMNYLQMRRSIKILQYLSRIMHGNKQVRVLDLGCGDGRFTAFVGEFVTTDAIELSEEAVKIAQQQHPHVRFFQGSALEYPFEKGYYDVVISQEVIEHIEDQDAYLRVCYEVLKPGGYLIMTTPNKKVFDHMEGGNWSDQPIEKIMSPKQFKRLVSSYFRLLKYDSIILDFGKKGYFKWINHRWVIGGCNKLGLWSVREFLMSKFGFGMHQCILGRKA